MQIHRPQPRLTESGIPGGRQQSCLTKAAGNSHICLGQKMCLKPLPPPGVPSPQVHFLSCLPEASSKVRFSGQPPLLGLARGRPPDSALQCWRYHLSLLWELILHGNYSWGIPTAGPACTSFGLECTPAWELLLALSITSHLCSLGRLIQPL